MRRWKLQPSLKLMQHHKLRRERERERRREGGGRGGERAGGLKMGNKEAKRITNNKHEKCTRHVNKQTPINAHPLSVQRYQASIIDTRTNDSPINKNT